MNRRLMILPLVFAILLASFAIPIVIDQSTTAHAQVPPSPVPCRDPFTGALCSPTAPPPPVEPPTDTAVPYIPPRATRTPTQVPSLTPTLVPRATLTKIPVRVTATPTKVAGIPARWLTYSNLIDCCPVGLGLVVIAGVAWFLIARRQRRWRNQSKGPDGFDKDRSFDKVVKGPGESFGKEHGFDKMGDKPGEGFGKVFPKVEDNTADGFSKIEDGFAKIEKEGLDNFDKDDQGALNQFPKIEQEGQDSFTKMNKGGLDQFPKADPGSLDQFPKGPGPGGEGGLNQG